MSSYIVDGHPAPHAEFIARALDPSRSVVIEACAGSGKTWLLVARIVRLLVAGVPPGRILAITFTRRAAQEMRERLFTDLAALARADAGECERMLLDRGMAAEAARHAAPLAPGLYERVARAEAGVTIETFHGWFWRLVQGAPLHAGAPYGARILENTQLLLDESWLRWCASLLRPENAALRRDYERLATVAGDESAERLVRNFVRRRGDWWCFAQRAPEADARAVEPMRRRLESFGLAQGRHPGEELGEAQWRERLDRARECLLAARPGTKTLAGLAADLDAWLKAPSTAGTDPGRRLAQLALIFLTVEGKARDALTPAKMAPKLGHEAGLAQRYGVLHVEILGRLDLLLDAAEEWDAIELTSLGLHCGEALLEIFQERKREASGLDFTDLEWHALHLLRDADIAAYVQESLDARYGHVLLDEFQDTNPLQWQVLQAWFASYAGAGARPVVFLVGDPKQSIYRFRGAEPRVFDVAREQLLREFGACALRTNVTRRNPPALVEAFNRVFGDGNPLYEDQVAHAKSAHGSLVVLAPVRREAAAPAVDGPPRDPLTRPRSIVERDERYVEGCRIAARVRSCVASLQVPVGESMRAARWSDVLVLVRRRTHLADLELALRDHGIAYSSARRGSLLEQLEVQDLIALLEFLADPFDDLNLARALRSPALSCTDGDLVAIAQAPGGAWWERLGTLADPGAALRRARELLEGWRRFAGVLPVHDLLDRILFESGARARYAAVVPESSCGQVQANIDALLSLALELDAGRFPSLTRFLLELRVLRAADDPDADEGMSADEDAVRLLTVHAAKGLEAPIVVLPDTDLAAWPEDRFDALVGWEPDQPAPEHFSLIGRMSALGSARRPWVDADQAQRRQEDWNLLYVAMTRAQQVLIVSSVESGKPSPESWFERIRAHFPPAPEDPNPATVQPVGERGGLRRGYRDFEASPHPTGERTMRAQSDAQRLGRAWHALLQSVDDPWMPAWNAERLAHAFDLSEAQAGQAMDAAQRVSGAPELARFFAPQADGDNELELVDERGATLRIDRLVHSEGWCWILDYKWSLADERLLVEYRAQLRRYAATLRACGEDAPIRMLLIDAQARSVPVEDTGG